MSKKHIIILSVLLFFVALIVILFGAVFCLRKIEVAPVDNNPLTILSPVQTEDGLVEMKETNITNDMIVNATGLKKGKSIFFLDKQKAKENIEKTYPSLKVVNIETVNVTKVKIELRARVGLYYAKINSTTEFDSSEGYYVLDEELVLVNKYKITESEFVEQNYTLISLEEGKLTGNKPYYSKLGNALEQDIAKNTLNAICRTVKVKDELVSTADGATYIERETFSKTIKSVNLQKGKVPDNLQELATNVYWLTITTKNGVTIKILRPDLDLLAKINNTFTAIGSLTEDNNCIICTYDNAGNWFMYQTKESA